MKVYKKADLVEIVAEEMGLPEKTVMTAVNSYWRELIQSVRDLKHLNIYINGVGELRVARSKLDRAEEKVIKNIARYKDEESIRRATMKLERIRELKKMRDQEYAKRQNVRDKRVIHDSSKNQKDLEKQVEDPGGDVV